ncbi:MAG: hypothetical protein DMF66_13435 [Acidobacteria bacterium]|nr:MAG: hypothetical protein DMF66_13435 [Acidobacteriota bacterium]
MAEHAHDPLPGLQLLLAQGPAQVGDDEELVRDAALAETAPAHAPAAGGPAVAGERFRQCVRRLVVAHSQAVGESEFFGGATRGALRSPREQALARAVHQSQAASGVEGEDGHVNLRHHRAQERRRFQSAEAVLAGAERTVSADADQLEQLLINLVRNAADASLVTNGAVRVGWRGGANGHVEIWVEDDGLGLASTANIFVPFFTTKPGGSGIGLVLSRQIAEAHSGTLTLENRAGARGCVARLRLPL